MGQSGSDAVDQSESAVVSVFRSRLGWLGLVAKSRAIVAVSLGQPDARSVLQSLAARQEIPESWAETRLPSRFQVVTWRTGSEGQPVIIDSADQAMSAEIQLVDRVRQMLSDYACGGEIDLADIPVRWDQTSDFRNRVYVVTRAIPRGEVLTYGEIARRVGSPGAARAVGRAMATNRLPLLIPCHRVVGGSGKLTGFSAPEGISLKQLLLELEAWNGAFPSAG